MFKKNVFFRFRFLNSQPYRGASFLVSLGALVSLGVR